MADVEEIELRLTTAGGQTVSRTLSGVKEEMQDMATEAEEAGSEGAEGLDRMGQEAQETAGDMDRLDQSAASTSTSTQQLGNASGQAEQFIFNLGDTAQDARYGLQGMGNNLGLAAEQAGMMIQQAGGAQGAMKALQTAIVGPAGAVLALQTLISMGPEIMEFLEGSEEATEQWQKSLEDAAGDMFEISEEVGSFEAATLEQARQVAEELDSQLEDTRSGISDLETLESLTSDVEEIQQGTAQSIIEQQWARGEEVESLEEVRQRLREKYGLEQASHDEIVAQLESERDRVDVLESAQSTVNEQIGALEAQQRLADALEETSADRADSEDETATSYERQVEEIEKMEAAALNVAQGIGDTLQGDIGPDQIFGDALSADDFQTQTVSQINGAIGAIERRLDQVDAGPFRQQMEATKDQLEALRNEMLLLKGDAIDLGPALQQGLADALASVASAVGRGENIAAAVLRTLADLAQRVGQMLIGFGTSALALQSLITNPVTAIAAGASLVALGAAAKSAISNEMDAATSGADGPRGEQGPSDARVPHMASGGQVTSGGMAVVGEEGPEPVYLPSGAQVAPHSELQTMLGAVSAAGPPAGSAQGIHDKLDEVATRFEQKQFRLRGTDQVTQQERVQAVNDDAGIK